jgi:hypothetical protein
MLIVKNKNGNRILAAEGSPEDMEKQFETLRRDTDFDTIELCDRRGRLFKQELAPAKPKKKAKKKASE